MRPLAFPSTTPADYDQAGVMSRRHKVDGGLVSVADIAEEMRELIDLWLKEGAAFEQIDKSLLPTKPKRARRDGGDDLPADDNSDSDSTYVTAKNTKKRGRDTGQVDIEAFEGCCQSNRNSSPAAGAPLPHAQPRP